MQQQMSQIPANAHHPRHLKRAQIQQLLALAEFLPPADRVLIDHVLGKGMPLPRLAKLYQRSNRQLRRQVEKIIKRLSNHMFRFFALQMNSLPAETRPTAKCIVLHGLTVREASETIGISEYLVRKHINTIRVAARLLT